jgi:hypothetical protein
VPFDWKELSDPPPIYRPAPFWAIDDKLEPDEIRRQVREMRQQGFGGGFFHSRVGLVTEYLSDEWFEAFGASLEQGRENGFLTWMYDEDLWPSGFAGGLVLDRDPDFAQRYLRISPHGAPLSDRARPIAWFALEFDDAGALTRFERRSEGECGDGCYVFYEELMPPTNRFGAQPYADLGNAEAMKVFIEMSYEAYRRRFGDEMGKHIPGCFTDEPAVNEPHDGCAWSKGLPDAVRSRHGYDLLDRLPLLFFRGPGYAKVRHQYRRTLNLLFVHAFSKQCYDWCEAAGIRLTGHYLAEDSLQSQLETGGATMPHYEYEQMPGIDFLCLRHNHELTLKQVSSAARQLGRKQVLSELFGVTGQQCTFEDQKWIGDYHLVMGVTFFCQHLFLYSMRGERKRDYPPTISYQNAYWPYYGRLNNYFSRIGYALSQGEAVAHILVLHPIGSAYAAFSARHGGRPGLPATDNSEVEALDEELLRLLQSLMQLHRDFDFGDEEIMERHASVKGAKLNLGQMTYGVVIVPPSISWRSTTFELLKRFAARGKVIFVEPVPTMVDAEESKELARLLKRKNVTVVGNHRGELEAALQKVHVRDASLMHGHGEAPALLYMHRIVNGKDVYFIANTDRHATIPTRARLRGKGAVVLYDAMADERRVVPSRQDGDCVVCDLLLPPVGACLLIVGGNARGLREQVWPGEATGVIPLSNTWQHQRVGPNVLTLDIASVEADGVDPGARVVYRVRRDLHDAMGFARLHDLQPWRVIQQGVKTDSGKRVRLRFEFESEIDGGGRDLAVVIEQGMGNRLAVNGQPVSMETKAWQFDVHFRRIPIAEHVVRGTNAIEITYDSYDFLDMVEEVYLVGDFGVRMQTAAQPVLTDEPRALCTGNWVDQGYPFFGGRMLYRQELDLTKDPGCRYRLRLYRPSGSCFVVRVNGEEAGFLASEPWHVDITDALREGTNAIEVEVVSTIRNIFGPLHLRDYRRWIGPWEFVQDGNWEAPYHFHPYGILEGALIEVAER